MKIETYLDIQTMVNLKSGISYKELFVKTHFKHDCTECKPLGELLYSKYEHDIHFHQQIFDLYFCSQNILPTVIARFGNGGHDYVSGMGFAQTGTIRMLAEALKRAVEMGYVNWNG